MPQHNIEKKMLHDAIFFGFLGLQLMYSFIVRHWGMPVEILLFVVAMTLNLLSMFKQLLRSIIPSNN